MSSTVPAIPPGSFGYDANDRLAFDAYDANGNVLNGNSHIYTWDADGRPVTIDGVGLTYDALGRMVEQNRSGAYTQIVYAPTGGKLALMNGQTLQKAFVPLPAGAAAAYNASGLSYYRHPDWLGSSRFASTPARTMYSSTAYAPFGEPYAQSGTTDSSFTGQNQDTVGGSYDFLFREYSTQGRWPSPDPAGLSAVDLSDPQSLDRYAYVRNSPTSLIDPLGLDDCSQGSDGVIHCTVTGSAPPPSPLDLLWELVCGPGGFGVYPCFTSTDVRSLGEWQQERRQALRETRQEQRQEQKGVEPSQSKPAPQPQLQALRPPTQQGYNACVQQATSTRDQAILQGRVEQAAGGISILGGIAVAGPAFSTLNQTFFKSGVEGAVHFAHAGGFAYGGAAAAFVPGYLYFKATISDIPNAWNQYYANLTSCAAPVPNTQ